VFGATNAITGSASYYINPVGIQSICLSAAELGNKTSLTTEQLTDFSVRVNLRPSPQAGPVVQFPLVQGAGFVTAIYNGSTPLIQSGVLFKTVTRSAQQAKAGVTKYKINLMDGTNWLLYAYNQTGRALDLTVTSNSVAKASGPFSGIIQVAKDPGNGEAMYDQASGAYVTGITLSGTASGSRGTYTFTFKKAGMTGPKLAMYALPHHQTSFDATTSSAMTQVKLQTTTKGIAVAVVADSWTMVEANMPTSMGFAPWSPKSGRIATISSATKAIIRTVASQEASQNMLDQTNQNSMYFSGKVRTRQSEEAKL
jgi:endo-1,3(4)-beta-glucanase